MSFYKSVGITGTYEGVQTDTVNLGSSYRTSPFSFSINNTSSLKGFIAHQKEWFSGNIVSHPNGHNGHVLIAVIGLRNNDGDMGYLGMVDEPQVGDSFFFPAVYVGPLATLNSSNIQIKADSYYRTYGTWIVYCW